MSKGMKRRVVVTGMGVVTSLSCKVDDLFDRLCAGESGVHPLRLFDSTNFKVKFAGDIYDWDAGDYIDKKGDQASGSVFPVRFGRRRRCGQRFRLGFSREDSFRCGVILGSGIGGLQEIETQIERLLHKGPDRVSPLTIPKLMLNAAGGNLSIRYGMRGPNYTVATACASATNAIGDALKTIQYDDADVMITGGTEAAVTPMGVSGFQNMKALSTRNDEPCRASRPFDVDRDGFVIAEGAGLLVLEELEHAKARGAKNLCRSDRFRGQRRRRPYHSTRRTGARAPPRP
jgi:3-oxoacyl-[acyl-carrier-protein] synthase II